MAWTMKTYAGNAITHKEDGAYRQAVTPDCVLRGCAITYSGTTLTIGEGLLLVAGRTIYNSASVSYTMPTTAAYAYVRLYIAESSGSITVSALASSSATPSLTHGAINATGTAYYVALAVVSIASGAISGIVSKLPAAAVNGVVLRASSDTSPIDTNYPDGTLLVTYDE